MDVLGNAFLRFREFLNPGGDLPGMNFSGTLSSEASGTCLDALFSVASLDIYLHIHI